MPKALVEILIEDPATERDLSLLELLKKISIEFAGEVEVRTFKYAGPHEHPYSIGILEAYKLHAVPSIVINGQLTFASKMPSKEELENAIKYALRHPAFKVSRG